MRGVVLRAAEAVVEKNLEGLREIAKEDSDEKVLGLKFKSRRLYKDVKLTFSENEVPVVSVLVLKAFVERQKRLKWPSPSGKQKWVVDVDKILSLVKKRE